MRALPPLALLLTADLALARVTGGVVPVGDAAAAWAALLALAALGSRWLLLGRAAVAACLLALAGPPLFDLHPAAVALALPVAAVFPRPRQLAAAIAIAVVLATVAQGAPWGARMAVCGALIAVAPLTADPRAAAALCLLTTLGVTLPRPGRGPPRVLVVTVEALRADTGAALRATGALADQGWATTAHTPAPWTLPALASLWTATYPDQHRAVRLPGGFGRVRAPTLFEDLAERGGTSVALSAGNPFTGASRGLLAGATARVHPWAPADHPLPRGRSPHAAPRPTLARWWPHAPAPVTAEALAAAAAPWLDRGVDVLWHHLLHLRVPLVHRAGGSHPGPGGRELLLGAGAEPLHAWRAAYDAAAQRVDAALVGLLAFVDMRQTFVVLTSDHGEAFGAAEGTEAVEHGGSLAPEVLHIPLAMAGPGLGAAPAHPVDLVDVGATLRAVLDLPPRGPGRDLRGATLPRRLRHGWGLYAPLDPDAEAPSSRMGTMPSVP